MAIDNLSSDDSRLSGAYIRTLVKQLTTTKSINNNTNKNQLTNNDTSVILGDFNDQSIVNQNETKTLGMAKPKNHPIPGHKKQVRRRLHTSRPYQERLLNMAEARKEIVTALKFHRASMKQASDKNQQRQQQQQPRPHSNLGSQECETLEPKIESPTFTNNNNNLMVQNLTYHPTYDNNKNCYPTWYSSQLPLVDPPYLPLPNQTLGLNLNLQAFANLDNTTFFHNNTNNNNNSNNSPSSCNFKYSTSSSTSPSSSTSSMGPRGVDGAAGERVGPTYVSSSMMGMHAALDEEEMEKIRSIGEQHQIEWDDTLDIVKSAWWFKFLKSRKNNSDDNDDDQLHSDDYPFGELMEFPAWLNSSNDQSFLQQHYLEDSCSEGTTLPGMDIGDIDGMDDEWLS